MPRHRELTLSAHLIVQAAKEVTIPPQGRKRLESAAAEKACSGSWFVLAEQKGLLDTKARGLSVFDAPRPGLSLPAVLQ
jgi:hypothetical protein